MILLEDTIKEIKKSLGRKRRERYSLIQKRKTEAL